MRTNILRTAVVVTLLLFALNVAADVYDPGDDVVTGNTSLRPGHPPVTRTLAASGGVADIDWFRVVTGRYRSYEVLADFSHPNSLVNWNLERYDQVGTALQQGSQNWYPTNDALPNYFGRVRQLRWQTTTVPGGGELFPTIKVTGDSTSASTNPYTIHFRETTLFCPRFNNSGAQITVLLLQSSLQGYFNCAYSVHFFNVAGALLATHTGTFDEQGAISPMLVLNTSAVPGLNGFSGNARVAHTCGLAGITGKLVALEPSTGFSFDTPCSNKEQ